MSSSEIIVVDDDPVALRLLTRIIEMAGYSAATARNGQEALEKVQALQPALVLLDLTMPKIDGLQVCQQIRNNAGLAHQPYIIMLTARDQAADYRQAEQIGVNEFINKPYDPAKISARVQTILGLRVQK
ncbi:MAG: response regulator [Anaerolineae bacterium]|nr:response regulator [Anaerolineae bacterium]